MKATFQTANPAAVEVALTMTATVAEWRKLRTALEAGGPEAHELGKKIATLIQQAEATLSSERWTTGYASAPVAGAA